MSPLAQGARNVRSVGVGGLREIYDEIAADKIWDGTRDHPDAPGRRPAGMADHRYPYYESKATTPARPALLGTVAESVDWIFTGRLVEILHGTGSTRCGRRHPRDSISNAVHRLLRQPTTSRCCRWRAPRYQPDARLRSLARDRWRSVIRIARKAARSRFRRPR